MGWVMERSEGEKMVIWFGSRVWRYQGSRERSGSGRGLVPGSRATSWCSETIFWINFDSEKKIRSQ
jgi:hypothetical protein